MELNKFIIDTVIAHGGGVKMHSYSVVASDAIGAFQKFSEAIEEDTLEQFPIVYEGEPVPAIIVGIQQQQ